MELNSFRNVLLRQLPSDAVLQLDLQRIQLPALREIESADGQIQNILFLEDGIASISTCFLNGLQVEVGLAGFESVLGASAFFGMERSLNRVSMLNEGRGYVSRTPVTLREFQRGGEFQNLVLRSTQAQLIQSMQTAGCNARHEIRQRLARWLLLCDDRLAGRSLLVSQDRIAQVLGIRRTSVSLATRELLGQKLISYSRSNIAVLNLAGLEEEACECYRVVRDHLRNYADSGKALVHGRMVVLTVRIPALLRLLHSAKRSRTHSLTSTAQ
jgi:CRP-like cAMP-binding protein